MSSNCLTVIFANYQKNFLKSKYNNNKKIYHILCLGLILNYTLKKNQNF